MVSERHLRVTVLKEDVFVLANPVRNEDAHEIPFGHLRDIHMVHLYGVDLLCEVGGVTEKPHTVANFYPFPEDLNSCHPRFTGILLTTPMASLSLSPAIFYPCLLQTAFIPLEKFSIKAWWNGVRP